MAPRRRTLILNCTLILASVVLGLAFGEVVLRQFTTFPIHAPMGNRVFDDRLLYRMDPNLAGIDSAGFRNPQAYVEAKPRVAAVGDSFTYGYNVARPATWPGRLADHLGEPVYNFGGGGYGLLQYIELVRMAAEAGYRIIVVGLLPENDMAICDAAQLTWWDEAGLTGTGADGLLERFCALDPAKRRATSRALFEEANTETPTDWDAWLLANSALRSAVRFASDTIVNRRDNLARNRFFDHDDLTQATEACADPAKDFVFPARGARDFIPEFHKNDLAYFASFGRTDETTREVFRRLVGRMKEHAEAHQARLVFLIIPGRRRVVARFLAETSPEVAVPGWILSLAAAEEVLVAMMRAQLAELGLPAADAIDRAVASYDRTVGEGRPHYPCFDGHPLEEGYQALGDTAAELVATDGGAAQAGLR